MQTKPGWIDPKAVEFSDPRVVRRWLVFPVTTWAYDMPGEPLTFLRPCGDFVRMEDRTGRTDFASTPPWMWSLPGMSQMRFALPAFSHDGFYRRHAALISADGVTFKRYAVARAWADTMLREMIEHDVDAGSRLLAGTYYAGVRLGGWAAWK